MQVETKKIFRCDFCKKKMFVKGAMEKHEQFCHKNPANPAPACFDCVHFSQEEVGVRHWFDGYADRESDFTFPFYCKKKDEPLHTKKAEVSKRRFIDEFATSLMPTKCEFQQKIYSRIGE